MKNLCMSYIIGFVFILLCSPVVFACMCDKTPNPPCRAYREIPVIFDGIVTESIADDTKLKDKDFRLFTTEVKIASSWNRSRYLKY